MTKADRKYILGQSAIDPQSHSERQARSRIRERLLHTILDLGLARTRIAARDREQVFDKLFDTNTILGNEMVYSLIGWGLAACIYEGKELSPAVESGLNQAIWIQVDKDARVRSDAAVSYSIIDPHQQAPAIEAAEKLDRGESFEDFTDEERSALFEFSNDRNVSPQQISSKDVRAWWSEKRTKKNE